MAAVVVSKRRAKRRSQIDTPHYKAVDQVPYAPHASPEALGC